MKNIMIAIVTFVIFALSPYDAMAWYNADAHMEINKDAIELFESDQMVKDLSFRNVCICGIGTFGSAWDKSDGVQQITQKFGPGQHIKNKNVKEWIVQGGFSADEPEGPMALRHFYDPTRNSGKSWITDQQFLLNFLSKLSSTIHNPGIDAKTWAIDTGDSGDEGETTAERFSLSQDYSWYDAKTYFIKALADKDNSNMYYGMAWRSVGETMHLVSDMTLPAHVRNDGHAALGIYPFGIIGPKTPIFGRMLAFVDPDPVEYYTDDNDVKTYHGGSPSSKITYDQPIDKLMEDVAVWTNKNFLSKDTIPIPGQQKMANGDNAYPSPSIAGKTIEKDYIWHDVDGTPTRMVHVTNRYTLGLWKTEDYVYEIDGAVRNSQNKILIPTAIRASASVLNRFLPRFEVTMQITQETPESPTYKMSGGLKFTGKYNEWLPRLKGAKFEVNNGAYIVINGQLTNVPKRANGDYTEFTTYFSAKPGDKVSLKYDFGGYVIESEPYYLPGSTNVEKGHRCKCYDTRKDKNIPPERPGDGQCTILCLWGEADQRFVVGRWIDT